jgi:hypothetical protein
MFLTTYPFQSKLYFHFLYISSTPNNEHASTIPELSLPKFQVLNHTFSSPYY